MAASGITWHYSQEHTSMLEEPEEPEASSECSHATASMHMHSRANVQDWLKLDTR